jgi:undecaprenyl-diphosphatase
VSELNYIQACVLGLVQGLTEFLPVSSSGHLVLSQKALGLPSHSPEMLLFDVVSHIGTVLAVFLVFRKSFGEYLLRLVRECSPSYEGKRTAVLFTGYALAACVPTAAIGLGFKDHFESAFESLTAIGVGLLLTGTLLFVVGLAPRPTRGLRRIGWLRAVLIGVAQGCAIFPGVSRSGATICSALLLGVKKRWSAEFSFFIAVPPIIGAGLIKLKETCDLPPDQLNVVPWGPTILGAGVAFVSGFVALKLLIGLVIREKIHHFSYYCWTLGTTVLALAILG